MNIKYPYFNEDHEGIREMAKDFAEKTLAPIAGDRKSTRLNSSH